MKHLTVGVLALLMTGATVFAPVSHATNIGTTCTDNATLGQNTVFAAGFAFGINWTPACITVQYGAVVNWQTADAEPVHGPLVVGVTTVTDDEGTHTEPITCWKAPAALVVPNADRDAVKLTWNAQTQMLDFVASSTRAANAASGGSSIVTGSCTAQEAGVTVDNVARTATLNYQCIVHKAAMTGHVTIKF